MTSITLLELLSRIIQNPRTLLESRLCQRWFTRNRKMSFQEALGFFFDRRRTTLQTRLNSFFNAFKKGGTMTQQGFSKLRGKFNHRPFELMLRGLVSEQYSGRHTLETWHGLYLFAVDGSYLQLPNTADVRERLGTRGRGKQCACAGASVLFDVLNGWVLNPILTHSDMNERVECGEHIDFIGENLSHIAKNSLLLLDRGYPSGPLLESLEKAELYYLIRCSSNFHSPVNKAGLGSTAVKLAGGQSVRVYKFVLPNGDVETLLTNLFDTPDPELALLYGKRWGIETLYTKLKNIVCVENFSGRTPNTVLQDFWASMVLLNSVAVFQKEADELVTTNNQGKKLKHKYRARTSDMVVTLRDRFVFACLCGDRVLADKEMGDVIRILASSTSPVRPGRSFPRPPASRLKSNLNLKSHL